MPRGFLVKRNKNPPPASYRLREEDAENTRGSEPGPVAKPAGFGTPGPLFPPVRSPSRPVREPRSSLGSPAAVESFPGSEPEPAALSEPEPAALSEPEPAALSEPEPALPAAGARRPAGAAERSGRRSGAARKPRLEDYVTRSPVLGLRIRAAPDRNPAEEARRPPGGVVCQLCREAYRDPVSLAQHRCSSIVRVEYRCPDCGKLFSCPANLASHRRWHKPRPPGGGGDAHGPEPPEPGPEDGLCDCPSCGKRFKRRAYLRKHLVSHPGQRGRGDGAGPLNLSVAAGHGCPVCGESFRSQERHLRMRHPAQVFPCKHCPALFHSSPGLTRHINKRHPSESRQVILLQVPLRPAC